ncbi:hypothetical protein BXZ70DRAFT_732311 [Cristinia sonorae]|uniref:Uncharacterized protein n=1 Tax=Cristinia sonorae TaxID=1940300 RepID=A0A8K0XSF9_9AGAR|nr:hypothetical protein BXZ70DRAFT_732311 [Cristinia sonorae]
MALRLVDHHSQGQVSSSWVLVDETVFMRSREIACRSFVRLLHTLTEPKSILHDPRKYRIQPWRPGHGFLASRVYNIPPNERPKVCIFCAQQLSWSILVLDLIGFQLAVVGRSLIDPEDVRLGLELFRIIALNWTVTLIESRKSNNSDIATPLFQAMVKTVRPLSSPQLAMNGDGPRMQSFHSVAGDVLNTGNWFYQGVHTGNILLVQVGGLPSLLLGAYGCASTNLESG